MVGRWRLYLIAACSKWWGMNGVIDRGDDRIREVGAMCKMSTMPMSAEMAIKLLSLILFIARS